MDAQNDDATEVLKERARPRTGPIVWGVLFLIFCAWVTQRTFFPSTLTPQLWLIFAAIASGVVLLGVGLIIGIRGRRHT